MTTQGKFTLVLCLLLAGCVSPAVHDDSFAAIDFSRYSSVAYAVHDSPQTEYSSAEIQYGKDAVDLVRVLLGQRLTNMGYTVVGHDAQPDLVIDLTVTAAKPGSAAARFWVSFGAGRAVFEYTAAFMEGDRKIAGFNGGQSYTGLEFGKSFASEQDIQTFAAVESVKQVETFMRNGGRFPPRPKPPTNPTRG